MEERISEKEKEKRKRIIMIIIAIIILLLIMSLFFIFYKKTYEVTFDSKGGSEVASVKVKDGDKVEEPDKPIKEGYNFAGWYYLDKLYDFDTPVKENMTLEAKWEEIEYGEIEGISLNVTELTLAPDGTSTLVATILPENANNVKLIWTSSDEGIATVDENGNIKALKEGTITITVSTEDGKYSASCTVTVKPVEEVVESETKSEENANNNNKSNKTNAPSTSSKSNTPSTSSTSSNPSTPNQPSNPSKPEPPKTDTYSITFTRVRQEGTNTVMQYKFVVYKNGSQFSAYKGFSCGGTKARPGNAYVSLSSEAGSASITLSDGSVVTATVSYVG